MLLAAVLVLIGVLVAVLVAGVVLVIGAVLLVTGLVLLIGIHICFLRKNTHGIAAWLVCPGFQALSLALKIRLTRSPAKMAMVMPPAAALSPPVKMPRNPCWSMASFTPLAKV